MRIALLILPLSLVGAAPAPDERRVMLTGFERIRVDGPFTVRVVSGLPPAATITGDRRAIDRVSVRSEGGALVIGVSTATWEGWKDSERGAVVTVGARGLRAAHVNGGGDLEVDAMTGQRVDLTVSGAGSLRVRRLTTDRLAATLTGTGAMQVAGGTARHARFMSYGAGSIDAAGLVVNDLVVHSQSGGDSRFTARFTAALSALGTGAIRVAGDAACRLAGPGPMSCAGKVERR